MAKIRDAEAGLAALVRLLTVGSGTVMVSSLISGVFFRYVLQDSLTWSGEVAMLCFSWMTLLAAALLVRDGAHVRVELIDSLLPRPMVASLRMFIGLGIFGAGLYMLYTGWNYLELTLGEYSAAIRYPMWLRNVSLPVSGVLIMIFSIRRLVTSASASTGRDSVGAT